MSAEAWPTEEMATRAVDAAARAEYEKLERNALEKLGTILPPWDEIPPTAKLAHRERVLSIVWAALTDLPDPRYAAFEQGRAAGSSDTAFECEGFGKVPANYPHVNPYPSGI